MKATLEGRRAVRPHLADISIGDRILVGVSGGADSLALAISLHAESEDRQLHIIPVILNHNLQSDSREIAERTLVTLNSLNITGGIIRDLQVEITDGLEASARRARYAEFTKVAEEFGADAIFLAHTHNDQAETVLLGLARGSGGKSLQGMAPRNGYYHRPFLNLTRATTEEICRENGAEFWSDPHNDSEEFLRVKVRKKLLPYMEELIGPGIADALVRTATILRQDGEALDEIANSYTGGLDCANLAALPIAIRSRVLRAAIYAAGAPSGSISADHLAPVEALVTEWNGQGATSLPGGVKVERISGRLSLSQQKENRGPSH